MSFCQCNRVYQTNIKYMKEHLFVIWHIFCIPQKGNPRKGFLYMPPKVESRLSHTQCRLSYTQCRDTHTQCRDTLSETHWIKKTLQWGRTSPSAFWLWKCALEQDHTIRVNVWSERMRRLVFGECCSQLIWKRQRIQFISEDQWNLCAFEKTMMHASLTGTNALQIQYKAVEHVVCRSEEKNWVRVSPAEAAGC